MDCLFCNKLFFDIFDRDPNFSSSLCQLLGLDLSTYSGHLTESPVCPECHQQAVQVKHMLQIKEIPEIKPILSRIKNEFIENLVRSVDQRSGEEGQLEDGRFQIYKGLGLLSKSKLKSSSGTPLHDGEKFPLFEEADVKFEILDDYDYSDEKTSKKNNRIKRQPRPKSYDLIDDNDSDDAENDNDIDEDDDIEEDDDFYKIDDSRDPEFIPEEINNFGHSVYSIVPTRRVCTRRTPVMKDVKIILEPIILPILEELSSTSSNSRSYNVNNEVIASFIKRDLKNLGKLRYEKQFKGLFSATKDKKKNNLKKTPRKRVINDSTSTLDKVKVNDITNNVNNNDNDSNTDNNVTATVNVPKSNGTSKSKYKRTRTKRKKVKFTGTLLPRTCEICDITFSKPWQLTIHSRIHTGEKPFVCHICPKGFRCNRHLTVHLRTHGIGEGIVQCEICGVHLISRQRVKSHYEEVHFKSVDKNFLCEYCDRKYVRESDLKVHQKSVHFGERNQFSCTYPDCDKAFSYKTSLTSHIRKEHEKAFNYICPDPECGRGFLGNAEFTQHLNITHQQASPEYQCPTCGKQFYFLPILEAHLMAVHDIGEKPFKCRSCTKGFVSKYKLERHEKAVHCEEKEKSKPKVKKVKVKKVKVKKLKIKKDKSNYEVIIMK